MRGLHSSISIFASFTRTSICRKRLTRLCENDYGILSARCGPHASRNYRFASKSTLLLKFLSYPICGLDINVVNHEQNGTIALDDVPLLKSKHQYVENGSLDYVCFIRLTAVVLISGDFPHDEMRLNTENLFVGCCLIRMITVSYLRD